MNKILKRSLWGILVGVLIGFLLMGFVSLLVGEGVFYVVSPGVVDKCGSELIASLLQFLLFAICGMSFMGSAGILRKEAWGSFKKTALYYVINFPSVMILGAFQMTNPYRFDVFLVHVLIYTILFFNVWLFKHLYRKNLKKYSDDYRN